MKTALLKTLGIALLSCCIASPVIAASGNAAAAADLRTLIGKIQPKIKGNAKVTEADLAAEIKEFDALLEKYKGDKSDDVAQILVSGASQNKNDPLPIGFERQVPKMVGRPGWKILPIASDLRELRLELHSGSL